MTFAEGVAAARELNDKRINDGLRELARDPRFPALIGWLERNREAWVLSVSGQNMAVAHGKLAHAAGSLHAVNVLLAQLAATIDKRAESGMEREV